MDQMLSVLNAPWLRATAHIFWWLFTRVWAPLMAIGWPLFAVHGALSPHAHDLTALNIGSHQTAVLIGSAGYGSKCDRSGCVEYPAERSYIIFPKVLLHPSIFAVEETDPARVREEPGAALIAAAVWLACVWATWHYWVRRLLKRRQPT
jgi:hypothetical protein